MARRFHSGSAKRVEVVLSESETDLERLAQLVIEMRTVCADSHRALRESSDLLRRLAAGKPLAVRRQRRAPPPRNNA